LKTSDSRPGALIDLARAYGRLEQAVSTRIKALCGAFCAHCASVCCRPVFCAESLNSPFLRLVIRSCGPRVRWDKNTGWMSPDGCRLTVGRPPVCHAFFCRAIAASRTSEAQRTALELISNLMTVIGRHALGSRHLIEVEQLDRIDTQRLSNRFESGHALLAALDPILNDPGTGRCTDTAHLEPIYQATGGGLSLRRPSS